LLERGRQRSRKLRRAACSLTWSQVMAERERERERERKRETEEGGRERASKRRKLIEVGREREGCAVASDAHTHADTSLIVSLKRCSILTCFENEQWE